MEENKVFWVVTYEVNSYELEGDCLEAVFSEKPTLNQLSVLLYNKKIEELEDEEILLVSHLYKGGGRINSENMWYKLSPISEGVSF